MLGPLLFNIFINAVLLKIVVYAIMLMTVHCMHLIVNVVKEKLYKDFEVLDTWFYDNYMALYPGKCNFMCLESNLSLDEISIYKNFKLAILP